MTDLCSAIKRGDVAAVAAYHGDVNVFDADGHSPLRCALYPDVPRRELVLAELLHKPGVDVDLRLPLGPTVTCWAAGDRRLPLSVLQQLVGGGASVNASDAYGWTPLHHAVRSAAGDSTGCSRDKAVYLLEHPHTKANAADIAGETPGMLARKLGVHWYPEIVKDAEVRGVDKRARRTL